MDRARDSTISAPGETLGEGGLDGPVVEDLVKHLFSPTPPPTPVSTGSLISSQLVVSLPFLPRSFPSDSSSSIAGLSSICPSVTSAPSPVSTIAFALTHIPSLAINTLPGTKWAVDVTVGSTSDEELPERDRAASPSSSLALSAQALALFHLLTFVTEALPGMKWSLSVKSVTRVEGDAQHPLEGEADEQEKWRANIEWSLKLNAGPLLLPLRHLIGSSTIVGTSAHEQPGRTLVTSPRTIDLIFVRKRLGTDEEHGERRRRSRSVKGQRNTEEVKDARGEVEKVKFGGSPDSPLRLVYVDYALPSTLTSRFPFSWIPRPIRSGVGRVAEAFVALLFPFVYASVRFFGLDHGTERLCRILHGAPGGRSAGCRHIKQEEEDTGSSSTTSNTRLTRSASRDQDPASVATHPPLPRLLFASILALVASALCLAAFAFDACSSLFPETSKVGSSIRRNGTLCTKLSIGAFAVSGDLVTLKGAEVEEEKKSRGLQEGADQEPREKPPPLGRSELDHLQEWFDLELEEGAQATLGVDGARSGSGEMERRPGVKRTSSPGSPQSVMTAQGFEDVGSASQPRHLGGKRVSFSSESAAVIGVAAGSPEPSRPASPPGLLTPPAAPAFAAPLSAPLVVVPSPPSVVAAPLVSSPTPISAPPSPGVYETDRTTYDLPRLATANNETSFLHFKVYHAAAARAEDMTESLARRYSNDEPLERERAKPWPEGHDLAAKEAALLGGARSGSIEELQAVQQVDELDALRRCRRMRESSVSLEDVEALQKAKLAKAVAGHEAALLGGARSGGPGECEAIHALEAKQDEQLHERLEELEREAYDSPVPRTGSPLDAPQSTTRSTRTHDVVSQEAALLGGARSGSIDKRKAVQGADQLEEVHRMESVRLELTPLEAPLKQIATRPAAAAAAGRMQPSRAREFLAGGADTPGSPGTLSPFSELAQATTVQRADVGNLTTLAERLRALKVKRNQARASAFLPKDDDEEEEEERSPMLLFPMVPEEKQEVEGKSLPDSPALEGKARCASRLGDDLAHARRPSIGTPKKLPIEELPTPSQSQAASRESQAASRENPQSQPQSRYWTPPVATGEMVAALDEESSIGESHLLIPSSPLSSAYTYSSPARRRVRGGPLAAPPPPGGNAADYPSPTSRFFTPPLASSQVPSFAPASPSPTSSPPGSEGGKTLSTAPTSPATVHEGGMAEKQQQGRQQAVGGAGDDGGEGTANQKKHKKKKKKKSKGGTKAARAG
ncbi:hypothetical protein JCM1841_000490 [Sporobolomyces salmonicolor]